MGAEHIELSMWLRTFLKKYIPYVSLWLIYDYMPLLSHWDVNGPLNSYGLLLHAHFLRSSDLLSLFPSFELQPFSKSLPFPTLPYFELPSSEQLLFPTLSSSELPSLQQRCPCTPSDFTRF